VVDLVIGNSRFSKVLMDGGSSLDILYAHTLRLLGIGLDQLRPSTTPFHGVAPGKRVQPLGQINLPVWFGTPDNYRKETLTFEVVGFRGAYHAILGRPCYAKFMAVPNYTYLKMRPSPPLLRHAAHCCNHSGAVGHVRTRRRHTCYCTTYGSSSTAPLSPPGDAPVNCNAFTLEAAPVQAQGTPRRHDRGKIRQDGRQLPGIVCHAAARS
jgi:hypothetical protein